VDKPGPREGRRYGQTAGSSNGGYGPAGEGQASRPGADSRRAEVTEPRPESDNHARAAARPGGGLTKNRGTGNRPEGAENNNKASTCWSRGTRFSGRTADSARGVPRVPSIASGGNCLGLVGQASTPAPSGKSGGVTKARAIAAGREYSAQGQARTVLSHEGQTAGAKLELLAHRHQC